MRYGLQVVSGALERLAVPTRTSVQEYPRPAWSMLQMCAYKTLTAQRGHGKSC